MINDSSDFRIDAMPFDGFKRSGIGREGPAYTAGIRIRCFRGWPSLASRCLPDSAGLRSRHPKPRRRWIPLRHAAELDRVGDVIGERLASPFNASIRRRRGVPPRKRAAPRLMPHRDDVTH
jgi:hypothetical protein